jgi:hypothetical protein
VNKIKESLKSEGVKTYIWTSRENFPVRLQFEGKEYEVKYTINGGLIMTGVKKINKDIDIVIKK